MARRKERLERDIETQGATRENRRLFVTATHDLHMIMRLLMRSGEIARVPRQNNRPQKRRRKIRRFKSRAGQTAQTLLRNESRENTKELSLLRLKREISAFAISLRVQLHFRVAFSRILAIFFFPFPLDSALREACKRRGTLIY